MKLNKDLVIKLRKKGYSYNAIHKKVNVPTSTIRSWCKDIALPAETIKKIKERNIKKSTLTLLRIQKLRKSEIQTQRKRLKESGIRDITAYKDNMQFLVFLGLYWGEGSKKGNQEVAITNSDLLVILICINIFQKIYNVQANEFRARLMINKSHENRVPKILDFWSKNTGIPLEQFTKTHLITSITKKNYIGGSYNGTLRVKVLKPFRFRDRLLSSIEYFRKTI